MPLISFLKHGSALIVVAGLTCSPSSANDPFAKPVGSQQLALLDGQQSLAGPDLHALRYYAQRGEKDKYDQEVVRLKLSYPGFQPPADPLNPSAVQDQSLWNLFAERKFDELEALITRRRATHPYWSPDPQLLTKISQHKTREKILQAYEVHDYGAVAALADANAPLLQPDDPTLLWAVAEALVYEKHVDASAELFEAMITRFDDHSLLAATIQKAARHLPLSDAAGLYKSLMKGGIAGSDGDDFKIAFARGLAIRANRFGFELPDNFHREFLLFGKRAQRNKDWDDLKLLAWSSYVSETYQRSFDYFSVLPNDQRHLKAIEGEILSLKKLGRISEAQTLSAEWKGANEDLSRLYVSLFASRLLDERKRTLGQDFLIDYSDRTKKHKSGAGAEALGWYAFNFKQFAAADAWFDKAIEWQLTETAAYGKVLVASLRKDKQSFNLLKARYGTEFETVAKLKYKAARKNKPRIATRRVSSLDRLSKAHKSGDYHACLSIADNLIARGQAISQTHQTRGWCLMQLDRPTEAQFAFEQSLQTAGGRSKSAIQRTSSYGAGLAALRRGKTRDADKMSKQGHLTHAQQTEISRGVLAQKATEAFRQKRYIDSLHFLGQRAQIAKEPRNLSELRAWSLFHVGDYQSSHRLFVSLNNVVSTKSVREGIQLTRSKIRPYVQIN